MVWLYAVIAYLSVEGYVILLHLVYLLTSIPYFELIRAYYTGSVLISLILIMSKIKLILVGSSTFLHNLMNILIKQYCNIINRMFLLIKGKLIYYLKLVELQIYVDYWLLAIDVVKFKEKLLELKSLVARYILILESVKQLLTKLDRLLSNVFGNFSSIFSAFNKVVCKLLCKFKFLSSICSKLTGISCSDKNGCTSTDDIIVTWKKLSKHKAEVSIKKINGSTITDFQNGVKAITEILKMIQLDDILISGGIMYIIGQLSIMETKNLPKLFALITKIQVKYLKIRVSGYVLKCSIEFFQEIKPKITQLNESLNFDCSNCREFLISCSKVENYLSSVSNNINNFIQNLAQSSKRCDGCILGKKPIELFIKLLNIIAILKFYVDLMAMEILIFKTIIINLVVMGVSSAIIEFIELEIPKITDINSAIGTLIVADSYLRAFYNIQLENTILIFGLSSKLKFSEFINQYYGVLVINLYLINRLIWAIECYIHHLIVFKYTSVCLNSQIANIAGLGDIIVQISNVAISTTKIINKFNLINNSITELNNIKESTDITNWKQNAQKIRYETRSVNTNVNSINSEVEKINGYLENIYESFGILIYLESFLKLLISEVLTFIEKNNKSKILETGLANKYYTMFFGSVMEPCNKELKFILAYLVDMWVNLGKLINVVETTILLIIVEMGWLKALNKTIESNVVDIDFGVEGMECAIEGVIRNFVLCSTKQLSSKIRGNTNFNGFGILDVHKPIYRPYSLLNVGDYEVLVNRMLEFWTFCDESVDLFKFIRFCVCALNFESKYKGDRPSAFLSYSLPSIKTTDINPVSELLSNTMSENLGNHLCLCLVIKYHLRPSLLKCILILRNDELGSLDTISRKFQNYNSWKGLKADLWKLCALILNIIYEITSFLRNNYTYTPSNINYPASYKLYKLLTLLVNIAYEVTYPIHKGIIANISRCCCMYNDDPYYHYIISLILYLSSLLENLWTLDPETIRTSIGCLSSLINEFEKIDSQENKSFNLNIFKLSFVSALSSRTQSCKLLAKLRIIIDLISLSKKVRILESFVRTHINHISLCNIFRFENVLKELKHYKGSNSNPSLYDWVMKKYRSVSSSSKGCNNSNCSCNICVNLIIFGIWMCIWLKVNIKLYESNKRYKERLNNLLKRICNHGDDCKCEELKTFCEQLCTGGCGEECSCSTLKEKLNAICNGAMKNCNGAGKCLCKIIDETFKKCAGGKNCKCIGKEECCMCVCCKLLGASIKILVRACTQNVLEPYKRIAIELVNCSQNKKEVMVRIVNGINQTRLNNIYLVKNTNLSHNYAHLNTNITVESRNWGYDTIYEHRVNTSNTIKSSVIFPNLFKTIIRIKTIYLN